MIQYPEFLQKITHGRSLSKAEAREAMRELMGGLWTPVQIAGYLMALKTKGETAEELAGSAEGMRESAVGVRSKAALVVDTCGTGGDGSGSFNLSTAAAFVVAGAGMTVAKHGNRSVSSRSGSADVLEALGIPQQLAPEVIQGCLDEVGLAFLFAPAFHPAMKHAMPVRRELGVRTIFNLLGPLTNPARPTVQLIGVYEDRWVRPVAEGLLDMGCLEGVVVHGMGQDEVSLNGETHVAEIENGVLKEEIWTPEDFGIPAEPSQTLAGGTPTENALQLERILNNEPGSFRQAVCLNAAALIRAGKRHPAGGSAQISLKDAFALAQESLTSGHAVGKLMVLRKWLAPHVLRQSRQSN